eukprot:COSAG06_NODE_48473_length_332_cov_0.454936_2_plen_38_part_01
MRGHSIAINHCARSAAASITRLGRTTLREKMAEARARE